MKKVLLTSMILLSAVSFGGNIYAQGTAGGNDTEVTTPSASQPSVKFTADGNTLTISGQGDLTSYMTTDYSAKVFTDKAVGFVFADADGKTPVAAGESYNAGKTYYQAEYSYTKVLEGSVPQQYQNGFAQVDAKQSWNEEKLGNLYYGYYNNWGEKNSITIDSKITSSSQIQTQGWSSANDSYDYKDMAVYFVCEGEVTKGTYTFDELESKQIRMITLADFNKEYIKSEATYYVQGNPSLFKSTDGGITFLGLSPNVKYTWTPDDVFYQGTASYAEIENNDAFFGENGEHADFIKADETAISFKDLLARKILEGVKLTTTGKDEVNDVSPIYESVIFVNENPSKPMVIDGDVVCNILYPNYNGYPATNITTTNLDLGAATIAGLNSSVFVMKDADYYLQRSNLTKLTLPLTDIIDNEMVVPSNVVDKFNALKLKTVVIPKGYTQVGKEAFFGMASLTNVKLSNTITEIGESAFRNCSGIQSIGLDDNLKTIGKYAFNGTDLRSLSLPEKLDKICDGAFWELKKLLVVELNQNLRYIGNGAFGCSGDLDDKSNTQTTIRIPASVKYIGAYAFSERKYQDIYFEGKTAPVCPVGEFFDGKDTHTDGTAFTGTDDKVHFGNSGFIEKKNDAYPLADDAANEGYANRQNYNNGGHYFTILHYPSDATDVDRYTDTTRKYECRVKADGTSIDTSVSHVGNEKTKLDYREATNVAQDVDPGYADTYVGTQYVWPSQSQFIRAYATAAHGVKWDGTTPYAPDLSDDVVAVLREAGYEQTGEELAKIAYVGTRKFSIANGDGKSLPSYKFDVKPGEWWTICVPFNMTKKQVLDAFGAETQLCLFRSVVRQIDINNMNHISLNFTLSTLKNKTSDDKGKKLQTEAGRWDYETIEESEDEVGDNDIILWAHESYMIKPYGGAYSDKEPTYIMANYEPVEGSPLPTIVHATTKTLGQADDFTEEYRFIGNYLGNSDARATEVRIPQYSYVYATTKKEPNICKFRFYTGTSAIWKPNKSIVQTNNRGGGLFDYNNFFGGEKGSTLPGAAKQASIFGDEDFGQTTEIDDVTIVVGSETLTPIFNLEGKMVRANGNVEGLAKGVYVKGGKKFIVK